MAFPGAQLVISAIDRTKAAFASVKNNFSGVKKDSEDFGNQIRGIFSRIGLQVGTLFSIKGLAGQIDEFNNLQARLKLVSRNTDEYAQAQENLNRIAASAKVPLAETATLYARIAGSVKDLNVSQEEIANTTEAVALGLRISGASAAESGSAMLQFSQAIASGVLRGEEFNAVNKAAPRVMQALANSLGVPVVELREMAKQGELTREILIDGLARQLPELREEAASLPDTIGTSVIELKNKLLLTAGAFDQVSGASRGVGDAINGIGTKGIEALAVFGANIAFVFKGVGREIGGIAAQLATLFSWDRKAGDFGKFNEIARLMREDAAKARAELDAFEKRILDGEKKVSSARIQSASQTSNAVNQITEKEKKVLSDSIDGRIKDYERLKDSVIESFSDALKTEQDYLREAKRLRAEANKTEIDPDDIEAQASAKLDAIIAAQKLSRIAPASPLEDVRDQADQVRALAESLADAAVKSDLLKQANLAEAAALEKAAAAARERASGLANQQTLNDERIKAARTALDAIEKGATVNIKLGDSANDSMAFLDEMIAKINLIQGSGLNIAGAAPSGGSAGLPSLLDATLKRGSRP